MLTKFQRLDKILTERGLVATSERAKILIQSGAVHVNGAVITAVQCPVNDGHKIEISGIDCPWVSPEALKLFEALDACKLDVKGRIAINLGAGVGGFEDVLLQKGSRKVFAVDKDFGLLHESLTVNQRIKNLYNTEAKNLKAEQIDETPDLIIADIGSTDLIENLKPSLSLATGGYDLLLFAEDKKALKDIEKSLRLEYALLPKRVPDGYQKTWEAKGVSLIWLQKKA